MAQAHGDNLILLHLTVIQDKDVAIAPSILPDLPAVEGLSHRIGSDGFNQ